MIIQSMFAAAMNNCMRAKCYQTVVRQGTYTGKVPVYNSLKVCKGTMFSLPLPLNKTLETLDQVQPTSNVKTALPNPELFIIVPPVNGKPIKVTPFDGP